MEAKQEILKVGSACVLKRSAIRNEKDPNAFFDHGDVGEVVAVFDTFYLVLSHGDLNYYYCDFDEVELFLGQI